MVSRINTAENWQMLGLTKATSPWSWVAHGKHPVASDFFTLGSEDSTTKAICEWIDRGYQSLYAQEQRPVDCRSWRFWLKSPNKDGLAFGVLKNSCDQAGRAYPLLLMGNGTLNGWEKHLHLLPTALEKGWGQMEYLTVKRYENLKQFKTDVSQLPVPCSDWKTLAEICPVATNQVSSPLQIVDGSQGSGIAALVKNKEMLLQLPSTTSEELLQQIIHWHMQFKSRLKQLPNAVFIGGDVARTYLAVFSRSLVSADLEKLWKI